MAVVTGKRATSSNTPPSWGESSRRGGSSLDFVRKFSADFWKNFLFFWATHSPPVVRRTRPFFLWFAFRYSQALRYGIEANGRRLLGAHVDAKRLEAFRRAVIINAYDSVYELGDAVRLGQEQLKGRVDRIDGIDAYERARALGRGAVLVTAHMGPFELGAAALLGRERRIHVLFHRDVHPRFDRLRRRLREKLGVIEVPVDDGLKSWLRLREAVLGNEVVLIQGDRVMPGQRGVRVPFGSGHAELPAGPIKLAAATGAPIVPIFSIRTGRGRVRVEIDEPILLSPQDGPASGSHPAMLSVARAIEQRVRAFPEQWITYEPFWCEDRS